MNTKTLLLGSMALAGFSTTGYAADLGVITSLDVCDELGLSGLKISSDNNCLVVSGGVSFGYTVGNYEANLTEPGPARVATFPGVAEAFPAVIYNSGAEDSDVNINAWLKFVSTADSDFGPATATIKLLSQGIDGTADQSIGVDEAWVGIGDTTVIMAGYKSTIFNEGDDSVLAGYPGFLGLFYAPLVSVPPSPGGGPPGGGVGRWQLFRPGTTDAGTVQGYVVLGGAVVQATSDLGNGVSVSGGLEGLGTTPGEATAVGVVSYAGEGLTAHVSGAANVVSQQWITHAGFTGTWNPLTVSAAVAADISGYYDAIASAAATIDMFTLAGSVEYIHFEPYSDPSLWNGMSDAIPLVTTTTDLFGAGVTLTAMVSQGVTLNLGGKYLANLTNAERIYQAEAQLGVAISQQLSVSGAVGVIDSTFTQAFPNGGYTPGGDTDYTGTGALGTIYYTRAQAQWTPGGGVTAGIVGTLTSQGAWQLQTMASKVIN